MKKVNLITIAAKGAWCSEREPEYRVKYWLEKDSFNLFYTGKLIKEFGYKNCDEIENSDRFFPLFKTDVVQLEKRYISSFKNKEMEEAIKTIIRNDNYGSASGYDVAFKMYIEDVGLEFDWLDYKRQYLMKDAEQWCVKNNIPYYIPESDELGSIGDASECWQILGSIDNNSAE